ARFDSETLSDGRRRVGGLGAGSPRAAPALSLHVSAERGVAALFAVPGAGEAPELRFGPHVGARSGPGFDEVLGDQDPHGLYGYPVGYAVFGGELVAAGDLVARLEAAFGDAPAEVVGDAQVGVLGLGQDVAPDVSGADCLAHLDKLRGQLTS